MPFIGIQLDAFSKIAPGMEIRRESHLDPLDPDGIAYLLQWRSLGSNRDKKPPEPLPTPSMLRVLKLKPEVTSPHQIHPAEPYK